MDKKATFYAIPDGIFKVTYNFIINGETFKSEKYITEEQMRKICPHHPDLKENIIRRIENDKINKD